MRIGLFFDRPYIDAHHCFIELIKHLVDSGFLVDLYYNQNPYNPPPVFFDDRIRVMPFPGKKLMYLNLLRQFISKKISYNAVFGTPIQGAWIAYRISKRLKIPLYYLADEVFDEKINKHNLQDFKKIKRKDIKANNHATRSIALSIDRFHYQKNINLLSRDHKYSVLPNAPGGKAQKIKSQYFRDFLNINDDKPIVLFIGTLKWSLAKQILKSNNIFRNKNYHVIFHGRTIGLMKPKEFESDIKFSDVPLPSYLMNYAVSSADIGLVLYDKDVPAESKNAFTGGKIGTYLKNGLPLVIGNDPSLKQLENKGFATFFNNIDEIDNCVQTILEDKEKYSEAALEYFNEKLDYNNHYSMFEKELFKDLNI